MVNEEKIKEQYKLALMDQNEEASIENHRKFYKGDYISKELIKSFFSGTIAFAGICILMLMADTDALLNSMNSIDYEAFTMQFIVLYLAFMAVYFIITYAIYLIRFEVQKRKFKEYRTHLKKLNKIYSRDEK